MPGCLLGWRSPATSGEALALVVLAYDQLNMLHAIADPPDRGRVERAYRLLHVALPMLAKAIEAKSVVAKVVEMFGNPAMAA